MAATRQLLERVMTEVAEAVASREQRGPDLEQHPDLAVEIEGRRDAMLERLRRLELELVADVAGVFAAFATTCREDMGLEPDAVLRAHFGPLVDQLPLEELECAEPDPARRAEWREVFGRGWRSAAGLVV